MAKRDDETEKLYNAWRQAEARYAELVSEFPDLPPPKVSRDSALGLAKARNKASHAADKYFKKALK